MQLVVDMVTQFTRRDAFFAVGLGALITHAIFRRWEPTNVPAVVFLLAILPGMLTTLIIPHLGILRGVLAGLLAFYTTMLTSIAIYRVTFLHPLSRYPGPLLCKLSRARLCFIAREGKQHLYIQALHNKYGDVVRIGPNEISIRDASVIPQMMGTNGLPKGPNLTGRSLNPPILALITIRDPVEHAQRRRAWTRAFNTAALKEYQPMIAKRVTQLTDSLINTKGRETNLTQWIAHFTFDFMGDFVFGGGTEMLRDGDVHGALELQEKGLKSGMTLDHLPWLVNFVKYLPIAPDTTKMRKASRARTAARFERGAKSKDLFYYLSNEDGGSNETPSLDRLLSDSVIAITAGSDTTASVLTTTLYFLMRNTDYYQRLRNEVDRFYPPEEDALDPKHHSQMPVLEAVINETLRMYPVVLSGSQRAPQIGHGDRVIGNYYIPEGTQVRLHFYSVHRDPSNFSYPDTWLPDRWLIAEGLMESKEKLAHNINAFIPFSFGPSNCVGKNLALQEMRTTMTYLTQQIVFHFADGYDPTTYEKAIEDQLAAKVPGLPVIVEKR